MIGGGNLVHCPLQGPCKPVTNDVFKFANGIVRGKDNLIYVAFSAEPFVGVYKFDVSGNLKQVHRIPIGMGADNLSVDSNGDIWVAGIPKVLELMGTLDDPLNGLATSTIFKIHKTGDGSYEVTKMLEDGEKKVLSSATTAIFDVRTRRLFIGGKPRYLRITK
jgi:arylesterase/paraoxonase